MNNNINKSELIAAWVSLAKRPETDHMKDKGIPNGEFSYWEVLTELVQTDSKKAYNYIAEITNLLNNEAEYAYIAAGPFEDLLVKIGDGASNFFDDTDQDVIQKLLPYVWVSGLTSSCVKWVEKNRPYQG